MIELDLRLCLRNTIIIYHDCHINGIPVESLTYDQVKTNTPSVVTLDEFFKEFVEYEHLKIYFDLKGKDELATILRKYIINNHILTYNIYIGSFNINHLSALKGMGVKLGFITCCKYTIPQYCDIIRRVDFICVDKGILDNDIINICRGLNKKIYVFTCEDIFDKRYISSFNVDGIVSNIIL